MNEVQTNKRKLIFQTFADNYIPQAQEVEIITGDTENGKVKIRIDHNGIDHRKAIQVGAQIGQIPGFLEITQEPTKDSIPDCCFAYFDHQALLNHIIYD